MRAIAEVVPREDKVRAARARPRERRGRIYRRVTQEDKLGGGDGKLLAVARDAEGLRRGARPEGGGGGGDADDGAVFLRVDGLDRTGRAEAAPVV